MKEYFPPKQGADSFHCPTCGVYAHQQWHELYYSEEDGFSKCYELTMSDCSRCHKPAFWADEKIIMPDTVSVEPFHDDFPEELKNDYSEAASIFNKSPKASAALIRLILQKLMVILGEKGKDINDDIGSLVRKGLSPDIQQAMDICRVIGNKAVHPGEIDLNDTPETAAALFSLINYVVEDRIARPKKLAELFGKLPEGTKKAIAKRDGVSS